MGQLLDRQMATGADLGAMGTAQQRLTAHTEGALAVGVTKPEIIIQMALDEGFSVAMSAIGAAHSGFRAFAARDGVALADARPVGPV